MKYKVVESFKGSPDGCRVLHFTYGDELVENSDFPMELIKVAMIEGWVKPVNTVKKSTRKKTVKAK